MTLNEIRDKFKIPLTKLKALQAHGLLIGTSEPSDSELIAQALRNGNPLSSRQLALLIRKPDLMRGLDKYRSSARAQLKAIGEASAEHFGEGAALLIVNASAGDPASITDLAVMIAARIPPKGCSYHYIAVRAGLGVSDDMLDLTFQHIARAIQKARQHPTLDGMSETANRETRFFPRREIVFDL